MSRNKDYQRLLNSKRWKELRIAYLRAHPLCEKCLEEGFIRSSLDVHHIVPVESAKDDLNEMERLCYSPSNLMALCVPCHIEIHRQMRSHQWQMLKKMPQADESNTRKQLREWVSKVSDGKDEGIKPQPKAGVRRTRYGWMTSEEAKAKASEELEAWIKNIEAKGNPNP